MFGTVFFGCVLESCCVRVLQLVGWPRINAQKSGPIPFFADDA